MKVLHQINFTSGLGADRWIVTGYQDAFVAAGHEFFFLTSSDDLGETLRKTKPDLLMIGTDRVRPENLELFAQERGRGMKVFLWINSMIVDDAPLLDIIAKHNPIDVYYGETEPEWMEKFTRMTGKPYSIIPNAANTKYHFPTEPVKKYMCEIAYLGANLPLKREAFNRLLLPLREKYAVRIYGPGWTAKDNIMRLLAKGARGLGLAGLNNAISEARISVPREEENQLYSSAKISLNIHEARSGTMKNHMILNERTFKIPACGGFEICDYVPPLRKYFAEDEVIMPKDDGEWMQKIGYYMTHEEERRRIQEKGTARALKDHTYKKRVEQILKLA